MASGRVIGITSDVAERDGRVRTECALRYAEVVARVGGTPVVLAPVVESIPGQVAACEGVVLTGGDDPRTERYGAPTHPAATPVHAARQRYEEALLAHLRHAAPDVPVLGVCLGMQMMALAAGGRLDQRMAESCDPGGRHWEGTHAIVPEPGARVGEAPMAGGTVLSRHRQCVSDAGSLSVIARADDGVIEAVSDAGRAHYVGVQWHPERTEAEALGAGLFMALIRAGARRSASASP